MIGTKLIFAVSVLVTVILLLFGVYSYGRAIGKNTCSTQAAIVYQKEVTKNAKIDKQVSRMDQPALDRALSRWVRE